MKTKSLFIFVLLAGGCFGQTSNGQANRTNFQIIDFMLDYQQKQLLDVAEAMPAEKYEFVPTGGVFQGVRSFAEQLKHVAADNYILGAGILGEKTRQRWSKRKWIELGTHQASNHCPSARFIRVHASRSGGDRRCQNPHTDSGHLAVAGGYSNPPGRGH